MSNDNNTGNGNYININFDPDEDFQDISSNSEKYNIDTEKIDRAFGDSKHSYHRKKRGMGKAFDNMRYGIYKWWKCMKKSKKALLLVLVSFVLVATVLVMTGGLNYLLYNYKKITNDPTKLGVKGKIDDNVMNIALFGIDSRDTKGKTTFTGNSDSIMILSLNAKTKKIKIISLLRDTFVPIEQDGKTSYGKINSAYAKGGPELAIKTINNIFDLDIMEYATVNFYGMADIIDAVGGIDVELTQSEVTARGENNHGINDMIQEICVYENLKPNDYYVTKWGTQHLNGVQAVAYSRIRYCTNIWGTTNDYGRTDRQRFVMRQLFNSVKNLSKSRYVKLANALVPCTQTSLELDKIISIGWSMMVNKPVFEEYRIPMTSADADTANGEKGSDIDFLMSPTPSGYGSVIYIDLDYAAKVIHAILYDDMTAREFIAQNPIQKNRWYTGGYSGGSSSTTSTKTPSSTTSSEVTSSSVTSSADTSTTSQTTSSSTESDTQTTEPDDTSSTSSTEEPTEETTPSEPQNSEEE